MHKGVAAIATDNNAGKGFRPKCSTKLVARARLIVSSRRDTASSGATCGNSSLLMDAQGWGMGGEVVWGGGRRLSERGGQHWP